VFPRDSTSSRSIFGGWSSAMAAISSRASSSRGCAAGCCDRKGGTIQVGTVGYKPSGA
jgi:hypothetical protein